MKFFRQNKIEMSKNSTGGLKRSLNLSLLVFYGLGIIIGAGVYVVIGDVVRIAGPAALLSFIVAGSLAFLTALCYAELASRYPEAAGAAAYVKEAFKSNQLSLLTGFLVTLVVLITAATIAHGAAFYAKIFLPLPENCIAGLIIIIFTGVSCLGVKDSVRAAAFMTVIELTGLVLAVGAGWEPVLNIFNTQTHFIPASAEAWRTVFLGAFFAFFAFTGFENLANMAEEAQGERRTIPYAILASLGISTVIYMIVALVVIAGLSSEGSTSSPGSLLSVMENSGWGLTNFFALLAMIAVSNGVLIQILMLARLFYGMARRELLPIFLSKLSNKQVPMNATLMAGSMVLISAYLLPFEALLRWSTVLTLLIFALVSSSVWAMHYRTNLPSPDFRAPCWVPPAAVFGNLGLIIIQFIL
jgi:APA family basic amino acid/polyamine antiporter